jgi:hypothetical protein
LVAARAISSASCSASGASGPPGSSIVFAGSLGFTLGCLFGRACDWVRDGGVLEARVMALLLTKNASARIRMH